MKFSGGKLMYSRIPVQALRWAAAVLTLGWFKYGEPGTPDTGWRDEPLESFQDALMRHFEAYRGGEFNDPEGCPHLAAVIVNAMFLLEMEIGKVPARMPDFKTIRENYAEIRNKARAEKAPRALIDQLAADVKRHRELWTYGQPVISDDKYDSLVEKLRKLDPSNEQLTFRDPK